MGWLELLAGEIAAGRPVALATVVEGPLAGRHLVVSESAVLDEIGLPSVEAAVRAMGGGRRTQMVDGVRIYVEGFLPPPDLIIIGAGHVAQPVAKLGKLLEFRVTVIDDRPDYANAARFPEADRIICDEFVTAVRGLKTGAESYAVLLTRGHRHDMACLRELIERSLAYIGMIGSRVRVQTVFRLLEEECGVDPVHFQKVYAPVGLDLGARTPGEIAVAIGAELLKVRRGGSGESLARLNRGLIHGR